MSGKNLANRQREIMHDKRGRPTLSLEFDVWDGQVSMWAHTRHEIPFPEMRAAFVAIRAHLDSFIADEEMCPFNPRFGSRSDAVKEMTSRLDTGADGSPSP